jgi:hypothetical protein
MKSKTLNLNLNPVRLALALTLLSALPSAAQSWQTVLNFQLAAGKGADGDGIVADASGNVFTAGNGTDASGTCHGLVLKTDTKQAVWDLSQDTNPSAAQNDSYLWDLGLDASGNVYSIGQLTPKSTGIAYWYVRKSADGGGTWSTVDQYQYAAGQWVDPTGFTADNSGNIYVVGAGRDAGTRKNPLGNLHWLVRRSSDGGQTWTLVDDVIGQDANAACFVPGAGLFVVGPCYASASSVWTIRRSPNGQPNTWSTVDSPFVGGAVSGISSDLRGYLYAAGQMFIQTGVVRTKGQTSPTGYYGWATRCSKDGGSNWQPVETYALAPNQTSKAVGVGRSSAGNVVVVGYAYDAQNTRHWIVRTPDASGTWQTVDDFQLQPGYLASALGVVTDAAGNLLVTGGAQDAAGSHWIVRRLAPTP